MQEQKQWLTTMVIIIIALLVGVTANYLWMSLIDETQTYLRLLCAFLSGGAVGALLFFGRRKSQFPSN